ALKVLARIWAAAADLKWRRGAGTDCGQLSAFHERPVEIQVQRARGAVESAGDVVPFRWINGRVRPPTARKGLAVVAPSTPERRSDVFGLDRQLVAVDVPHVGQYPAGHARVDRRRKRDGVGV